MKKLNEHEAWTEIATALETMRTMPSWIGTAVFWHGGLCTLLGDLASYGVINYKTYGQMDARVIAYGMKHKRNFDNETFIWPRHQWKPRAKFARRMARLTKGGGK